jgi:hypothetical protein
MAKTVPISDETKQQIDTLKKYYKRELTIPVELNQKVVVEIAISNEVKRIEKKNKFKRNV